MIIRNGQKLGSVLVNSGEDEPKEAKKKTPAKKSAGVQKAESTEQGNKKGDDG